MNKPDSNLIEDKETNKETNKETDKDTDKDPDKDPDKNKDKKIDKNKGKVKLPSRHNLQLGRRLFHFANGAAIATMYNLFWEHNQVVYIIGLGASLLYIVEQVRLAYPELANKFSWISNFLLRAEEEIKESAAVPYAMALLLTIISFPKTVAVIAIYTLSISDPLSAIIGITYGKKKIVRNKSLEGSLAFFISTLIICLYVLINAHSGYVMPIVKASILIAFIVALFELIPLRLDDNLTIPLFTSMISWTIIHLMGIPV
ncbi:MAG: hypothetical protein HQK51_01665 [Oligoflexia bacterium]|nr:hypothetical protein [Oligoflexia bacterium]